MKALFGFCFAVSAALTAFATFQLAEVDRARIAADLQKYRDEIRLKATELGARALIEDLTPPPTTTRKQSSPRCR